MKAGELKDHSNYAITVVGDVKSLLPISAAHQASVTQNRPKVVPPSAPKDRAVVTTSEAGAR